MEAVENQRYLHKTNLENNENEFEQKLKDIRKDHEHQLQSLEMKFENKKAIFKKVAEKEHEILWVKNQELQFEIEKLNTEIDKSKQKLQEFSLSRFSSTNCYADISNFEENHFRQKYQSEIEQLKVFFFVF